MRVLLIEDDAATAQSIELMLKSENFNVYVTDLGEEGIDLGKLYDYDIILLDLNLPDMSGYEVLRSLRVTRIKTPILILSGMAGIQDKVKGLGHGADDYLTKPFHNDELVARIHAIVRRSKGHAHQEPEPTEEPRPPEAVQGPYRWRRPLTIQQTVHLPPAVHDQLRELAFHERVKMHAILLEGLDRVFKDRGLKPLY